MAPARKPFEERFWSFVEKTDDCWLWIGSGTAKYGLIRRPGAGNGQVGAHRASWELAHGSIPDGLYVCHRCDDGFCVRPDHLFLGTCAENMADCVAKGRQLAEERNPAARLTVKQVQEIRQEHATGRYLHRELADRYGVARSTVSWILSRGTWANV